MLGCCIVWVVDVVCLYGVCCGTDYQEGGHVSVQTKEALKRLVEDLEGLSETGAEGLKAA